MDLTYGVDLHVFSWKQAQKYVPEDVLDDLELADQGVLENGYDQDLGESDHAYVIGFCNGVMIVGSLSYKYYTLVRLEADLLTQVVSGVDTISTSQSCVFFFHLLTRTFIFAQGYKIPKFEQLSVVENYKYTRQFSVYTKTHNLLLHLNILIFEADKLSSNVPLVINPTKDICSICLEYCHTATSCGHYVCQPCINLVDRKICPQCRQNIAGVVAQNSQTWGPETRVGSVLDRAPDLLMWKSSFNSCSSFQEFGQVIKSKLNGFSMQYQNGVLTSSPDGWCVIHSLLQLSKWDTMDQLETFVWDMKALGSDGQISVQTLSEVMNVWRKSFNLKIQLTKLSGDDIHYPSLVYVENGDGTGHVGWYTPKKFQVSDRFYLPHASFRKTASIQKPLEIVRLNPIAPLAPAPKKRPAILPLTAVQKIKQPVQSSKLELVSAEQSTESSVYNNDIQNATSNTKTTTMKYKRNVKSGNSKHTRALKLLTYQQITDKHPQTTPFNFRANNLRSQLNESISSEYFVSIPPNMRKMIQTYLRTVLRRVIYSGLPDLRNESDKDVLSSVHYIQLGYLEPNCVLTKPILSKKHFQILASLQKSRHPWLFLQGQPIVKAQMIVKQEIKLPQLVLGSVSNLNIKPLMVSSSAQRSLQGPLIASIHQSGIRRIPVKSRTYKSKLSVDKQCNVIANPNGVIHSTFAEVLSIYGQPITQDQISQSYEGCGGHSHLRFGQDLNQAQILTRLLNDLHVGKNNIIVDVGSKFLSMGGLMINFVKQSVAKIMGDSFESVTPAMSSHDLLNECGVDAQQAEMLIQHPRIIFCPVRPRDTEYNKVYYAESLQTYLSLMHNSPQWMYGYIKLLPPYEMTVQDFDQCILPSIKKTFDDSPAIDEIVSEALLSMYRRLYLQYGQKLHPDAPSPCAELSLKQIQKFFHTLKKDYPENKVSLQDFYSGDISPLIDALKLASVTVAGSPLVPSYLSRARNSLIRVGDNVRISEARMQQIRQGLSRFRECIQLQFSRMSARSNGCLLSIRQSFQRRTVSSEDQLILSQHDATLLNYSVIDIEQDSLIPHLPDVVIIEQPVSPPIYEEVISDELIKTSADVPIPVEVIPEMPIPLDKSVRVNLLDVADLNSLVAPSPFVDEIVELLQDDSDEMFFSMAEEIDCGINLEEASQDSFHSYTLEGVCRLTTSFEIDPQFPQKQLQQDIILPLSCQSSPVDTCLVQSVPEDPIPIQQLAPFPNSVQESVAVHDQEPCSNKLNVDQFDPSIEDQPNVLFSGIEQWHPCAFSVEDGFKKISAGCCFFKALSFSIFGSESHHMLIKNVVRESIRFSFVNDEMIRVAILACHASINRYISLFDHAHFNGGEIEASCFSKYTGFSVTLLHNRTKAVLRSYQPLIFKYELQIVFSGIHYDAITGYTVSIDQLFGQICLNQSFNYPRYDIFESNKLSLPNEIGFDVYEDKNFFCTPFKQGRVIGDRLIDFSTLDLDVYDAQGDFVESPYSHLRNKYQKDFLPGSCYKFSMQIDDSLVQQVSLYGPENRVFKLGSVFSGVVCSSDSSFVVYSFSVIHNSGVDPDLNNSVMAQRFRFRNIFNYQYPLSTLLSLNIPSKFIYDNYNKFEQAHTITPCRLTHIVQDPDLPLELILPAEFLIEGARGASAYAPGWFQFFNLFSQAAADARCLTYLKSVLEPHLTAPLSVYSSITQLPRHAYYDSNAKDSSDDKWSAITSWMLVNDFFLIGGEHKNKLIAKLPKLQIKISKEEDLIGVNGGVSLQLQRLRDQQFLIQSKFVPKESKDREYLEQSGRKKRVRLGCLIIKKRLEQFQKTDDRQKKKNIKCRVSYYMSDVHYYLPGWVPSDRSMIYAAGGVFHPFPGQYDLPMGEGSFSVLHNGTSGRVVMTTQGQGIPYDHPFVNIRNPTYRMDYGWYSHVGLILDFFPGDLSPFEPVYIPPFFAPRSIQGTYLSEFYESKTVIGLKTINDELRYWNWKKFTEKDISDFGQCYQIKQKSIAQRIGFWFGKTPHLLGKIEGERELLQKFQELQGADNWQQSTVTQSLWSLGFLFKKIYSTSNAFHKQDFSHKWRWFENRSILSKVVEKPSIFTDLSVHSQHDILLGNLKSDRLVCQAYNIELQDMNPLQCKMGKMLQEGKPTAKKLKGQHEFVSKDYFQAIPLSESHINMPDIKLLPAQPEWVGLWESNVSKIRQWVCDHPHPVVNNKNRLSPFDSQGQVIPSGYSVIDVSNGAQLEFEWSSKVVQNGIFALFQRQFASSLSLVDEDLLDFDNMTDQVFEYFDQFLHNYDWVELQNSDPFVWLDSKDFDQGKKDKYQKTIQRQLNGDANFIGSFKTMVKSGEINYTTQMVKDEYGRLINQDTRPRNICVPSATSCGLLTWIQSTIFPVVKKCFPGFIQGLNKDQLLSRFRTGVSEQHESLSLDGSSFDSTQYEQIMKLVDTKLWKTLAPHMETWLQRNQSPSFRSLNIKQFVDNLHNSAVNYSNILFTNIPGVQSDEWPMDAQNQWNRDWAPEYGRYSPDILQNWCVFKVQGTTFSGHPTLTTLGNTFRELCYLWWYCRKAGFDRVWDQKVSDFLKIFVCAAGDDGLIQSLQSSKIKQTIFKYSSTTKVGQSSLGQCIKDVKLSRWDDIDFCSKWSFSHGDVNSLTLFRDLYKTLTTKQYYTKNLSLACIYPQIHAQALLEGLKSEHTSYLLEDILRYRVYKFENIKPLPFDLDIDLSKFNSQLIHTFNDDSCGYDYERQINDKLNINLFTLLKLLSTDQLVLGQVRRDHDWVIKHSSSRFDSISQSKIIHKENSCNSNSNNNNNNNNNNSINNLQMSDKNKISNNNNNSKEKSNNNSRRRRRPRDGALKVASFANDVSSLKKTLGVDMTPRQVQETLQDKESASHPQVVQLVSHIENSSLRNQGLMSAIGLKFASKASMDLYSKTFSSLSVSDQRHLLSVVLADDWGTVIKGLSKAALPMIWSKLKTTTFGQKALKILHDYTGIDMNDDKGGYLGNQFTSDPSLRRQIQWDEMSPEYANSCRSYDGVSTQAIASILFPEYTSSRVPSDVAIKCGKVSRQQTITITTNASGNAIFAIYPLCPQWSDYIQVWNDSTLNVQSGIQTPSSTTISGPLYNLTSVVSLRTTATSCIIEPIVSSLNNQGRIITVMSNSNNSQFTTAAPTGSIAARDREYVTYSSVAGSTGHRMSYYDSSVADEGFIAYGASPDRDFMQVIVEGAAPSTAVFQITYTYQVEYTINSNVLIELAMPPTGPATMKCLATSMSQNPQLRLIGRQESKELYMMILQVQPRYDSVMRLLVNHVLSHPYESVHTGGNSNTSNVGYDNNSMSDYNFQPMLASE